MRVLDIIDGTSVDGPGFRTAIYFAGCRHCCPGCHNPSSWDMHGGKYMSVDEIMDRVITNDFNVTFSGGDPLYQAKDIIPLARKIHMLGKTIWCYTGFKYEHIVTNPHVATLFDYVDVLVDGEFIQSQRDLSLIFRGSSNQRIIDIRRSTPDNIILWESDF